MNEEPLAACMARLRFVLGNMQEVLEALDAPTPPSARVVRVRVERWTQAVESILAQADAHLGSAD